uniref:Uncharacterized protein n=1 Tax=Helianthus annuus TaxID=4232 RepID=A0A251TX66_HELAN
MWLEKNRRRMNGNAGNISWRDCRGCYSCWDFPSIFWSLDIYGACTGRSRSLWSMDYVLNLLNLCYTFGLSYLCFRYTYKL